MFNSYSIFEKKSNLTFTQQFLRIKDFSKRCCRIIIVHTTKMVKIKEVSSRLLKLNPKIVVIIETRVRMNKAAKIRDQLELKGLFIDNYDKHDNGRIQVWWNNKKVEVRKMVCTEQLIHCGIFDMNGNFLYWFNVVYGLNHLDQRKRLWKDFKQIHQSQQGPWCLIGDFNNVLKIMDRMKGNMVHEKEYKDLSL